MHHSCIRPWLEARVCSIFCRFWWRPTVLSLELQTSMCGWAVAISALAKWMLWFIVLECLSLPRGTWPVALVTVLGCVGRGCPMSLIAVGEVKACQPKGRIWRELKVNCWEIIHPNHQSARLRVENQMTVGKFEAEDGGKSLWNSWGRKNRLSLYFAFDFPFFTAYPALAFNPNLQLVTSRCNHVDGYLLLNVLKFYY